MINHLKNTKSYKHMYSIVSACASFLVIGLLFFVVGIVSSERALIAFTFILNVILAIVIYVYLKDIRFILKEARTFQRCEGKCVNVSENQNYRGYTALMIEFVDFVGEPHRMPTHAIFNYHLISSFIEKDVIVYYSPKYTVVLID